MLIVPVPVLEPPRATVLSLAISVHPPTSPSPRKSLLLIDIDDCDDRSEPCDVTGSRTSSQQVLTKPNPWCSARRGLRTGLCDERYCRFV
jgi:hypothetical protein